jgi:tetratricopeptide (TPR) repeat protein
MPRRPSDQHIDNPAAVGRRLRQTRIDAGLSQRALAFPGCTPAYISRIEAGQRIPSLQLLRELANRIGVDVEYLARGDAASAAVTDPLAEAELELRLGDVEAAEEHFTAVASADETPDHQRARALAGLGQIAFGKGENAGAIKVFEQALELRPRLEVDDPAVADSLGRAYAMTGQYERARSLFERRYAEAQERRDLIQTVRFAVLLANTLADAGSFERAEELLGQALQDAADGDPLTNARLWWTRSRLHTLQNEPVLAEKYAHLALDTLLLTEHTRYVAIARQVLAHIYLDQDRAEEALEVLEPARATVESSESAYDRGIVRLELARALLELDRLDEALPLAAEAAAELEDVAPGDAGRAHEVIAKVQRRRGDLDGAIESAQRALALLPGNNDRYRLAVSSLLAEMLREQGRSDEALDVLAEAVRSQSGERQLS